MFETIGNVKLNTDFLGSDECFSQADFDELISVIKSEKEPEDVFYNEPDYLKLENFSFARENIIQWYPFSENSDILELRAECGAVTSCLAKKARSLISFTDSALKAQIIAERNRSLDNLEIYAGSLPVLISKIDRKFDYIVLLGGILDNDTLKSVKNLLRADGKLLIATENRLGMKYISGCKDSITGKLYDGVDGYRFSKAESYDISTWKNVLKSVGFNEFNFRFPYPDYKMCEMVFSDKFPPAKNQLTKNVFSYESERIKTFDDNSAFNTAIDFDCFPQFSNSFFIETGKNCGTIYVKFSKERNKDKRIYTVLTDCGNSISVKKFAADALSVNYVQSIKDNESNLSALYNDDFCVANCRVSNGCAEFDYIKGIPLSSLIDEHIIKNSKEDLYRDLDILKNAIKRLSADKPFTESDEFKSYFGDIKLSGKLTSVKYSFIDLIADNLIIDNKITIIDYEWVLPFDVPLEYIAFRSLFNSKGISMLDEDNKRMVYNYIGVNYDMFDTFLKMEIAFQKHISSPVYDLNNLYSMIAKPVYDIRKIDFNKSFYTPYAIDAKSGKLLFSSSYCSNDCSVSFSISNSTDEIIFVPSANSIVMSKPVITANKSGEAIVISEYTNNAECTGDNEFSFNLNPQIRFKAEGCTSIQIKFTAYIWNSSITERLIKDTRSISKLVTDVESLRADCVSWNDNYYKLDKQFSDFRNSKVINLIPIKLAIKKFFNKFNK